jgi:hypothetical protein
MGRPSVPHQPPKVTAHVNPRLLPSYGKNASSGSVARRQIRYASPEILRHSRVAAATSTAVTKHRPAMINQMTNHCSTDPSP